MAQFRGQLGTRLYFKDDGLGPNPFACFVAGVLPDGGHVNLTVLSGDGNTFGRTGIFYKSSTDPAPAPGTPYCFVPAYPT